MKDQVNFRVCSNIIFEGNNEVVDNNDIRTMLEKNLADGFVPMFALPFKDMVDGKEATRLVYHFVKKNAGV